MSLVGPRPIVTGEVAKYGPYYGLYTIGQAGHHRAVAGVGPQQHDLRRARAARRVLRAKLVAVVGRLSAAENRANRACSPKGPIERLNTFPFARTWCHWPRRVPSSRCSITGDASASVYGCLHIPMANATHDARPGLAMIANVMAPYRLNLHKLVAAGIPELKLHTLITHGPADFDWNMAVPEAIHVSHFGAAGDSPTAGTFATRSMNGKKADA